MRVNKGKLKPEPTKLLEHLSGCRVASALVRPALELARAAGGGRERGTPPTSGAARRFTSELRAPSLWSRPPLSLNAPSLATTAVSLGGPTDYR